MLRVAHFASGFNPVIVTGRGNITSSGQEGQSTENEAGINPYGSSAEEALHAEMAADTVNRVSEGGETGSRYRSQGSRLIQKPRDERMPRKEGKESPHHSTRASLRDLFSAS